MISSVFLDQFIRRLGLALSPHLFLLLLKKASFMHKNTKTFLKISIFYLFVWVLFVSIWISPILYIIYPVFLLSLLLRHPPQPSQFSTSALTTTLYNLCLTDFSSVHLQLKREKNVQILYFLFNPAILPYDFLLYSLHIFFWRKNHLLHITIFVFYYNSSSIPWNRSEYSIADARSCWVRNRGSGWRWEDSSSRSKLNERKEIQK